MTHAVCTPLSTLGSTAERERRPDRFVELLDCLADLLVETRGERQRIQDANLGEDPRVSAAVARLAVVEVHAVMSRRTPPASISSFSTFEDVIERSRWDVSAARQSRDEGSGSRCLQAGLLRRSKRVFAADTSRQ